MRKKRLTHASYWLVVQELTGRHHDNFIHILWHTLILALALTFVGAFFYPDLRKVQDFQK